MVERESQCGKHQSQRNRCDDEHGYLRVREEVPQDCRQSKTGVDVRQRAVPADERKVAFHNKDPFCCIADVILFLFYRILYIIFMLLSTFAGNVHRHMAVF